MAKNLSLPPFRRGDFIGRQWVGKPMTTLRMATINANLRRVL